MLNYVVLVVHHIADRFSSLTHIIQLIIIQLLLYKLALRIPSQIIRSRNYFAMRSFSRFYWLKQTFSLLKNATNDDPPGLSYGWIKPIWNCGSIFGVLNCSFEVWKNLLVGLDLFKLDIKSRMFDWFRRSFDSINKTGDMTFIHLFRVFVIIFSNLRNFS